MSAARAPGLLGSPALLSWIGVLALGVLLPFLVYPVLAMEMLCFALFASAFNLLLGYGGLLSFGHAAFFGIGAYVCGHAAKVWQLDPLLALACGTAAGVMLGVAFGAVAIRRQGIYFAMVTLALAQIVYFVLLQAPFTGGEDGLQGIPRGALLGVLDLQSESVLLGQRAAWGLYGLVLAVTVSGHFLIARVLASPTGLALRSVQEHEPRARSLGLPASGLKFGMLVLSAGLAALAGALKALVLGLAALTDATWQMSGEVVLMTLIGGVGTLAGPAVGAGLLRYLHHTLAGLGSWVTVVLGGIFVFCVLVFRRGMIGEWLAWWQRSRAAVGSSGR
ncbi:MAG: branched-chain amino acid ABC transporter permease [Pseudomonadota bacterium]|nr:branched-chain amino acid ABC transporter permease [Pseudomonadota bacterium]